MKEATLGNLRDELKKADREIIKFLHKRTKLSIEIGKIKDRLGMEVYDAAQEAKIFEHLAKVNGDTLPEKYMKAIFREIISASRAMQKPLTVAFLGPEATFSHLAAQSYFGTSTSFIPQTTIYNVFDEVEKGKIQCGVVPVENSLEGSINLTLDRLISTSLSIRAEIFLRISHCLLSKSRQMDKIKRVYSIPTVLAQCQGWLRTNLPHCVLVEAASTAAAARIVQNDSDSAAIGSRLAAVTYGLNMLSESIEDHTSNTTRFLVIGQGQNKTTGRDKMSILFGTPHHPGALYHALKPFAKRQINLMKIESYPVKERLWEYLFFVDFRGHMDEDETIGCINDLKKVTTFLKVLGSYPEGEVSS